MLASLTTHSRNLVLRKASLKPDPFYSFAAWLLSHFKSEKGDLPGHEFHGNQWTGGAGGKPTTASTKDKTAALKELLASGHHWGISEIAHITGASTTYVSKTLKTLEGVEHNGLTLVKEPGGYVVKSVSGADAAPSAPDAQPEPVKSPEPSGVKTSPTSEAQIVHPSSSTPMSKASAGKIYDQAMQGHLAALHAALNDPNANHAQATLGFKAAKALEMAKYTANTSGSPATAKGQQLYTADAKFAENMKEATTAAEQQKAYSQWKADTAAEKAGTFNPASSKPATSASAPSSPPASASPEPSSTKGASSTKVGGIVPSSWKGISASDFSGNSKWAAGMDDLKAELANGSKMSSQNKEAVTTALNQRLASSKEFQAVEAAYRAAHPSEDTTGQNSLASRLIGTWASTSGDHSAAAVAMQLAVRDVFGMDHGDLEHKAYAALLGKHTEESLHTAAAAAFGIHSSKLSADQARAGFQAFIRAQYDNTQEFLASRGIKELYLARGMRTGTGTKTTPKLVKLGLQPASSFSANYSTAQSFAGKGGRIYLTKVPASQVLGTYRTGYGCTGEHEVVVLADPKTTAVRIGSSVAHSVKSASGAVSAALLGAS